jgi:hypothetical protein
MSRLIFAAAVVMAAFGVQAGSVALVCGEECRGNVQVLDRKGSDKVYINLDMKDNKHSGKVVLHKEFGIGHLGLIGTFSNGYRHAVYGVGYDFLDKGLLGLDVGIGSNGKSTLFGYWGIPLYGRFTSDGFVQVNDTNWTGRGNLMYNLRATAVGYELTGSNGSYVHEAKFRWSF